MAVQLGHDNIHSQNWYANEAAADKYWNNANAEAEYNGKNLDDEPAQVVHHDTINQAELYNGMAVQLGYENIHSNNWYAEQEAQDKEFDAAEIRAQENSSKSAIENMGMTPAPEPEVRHINKDVDFDIYNGISLL